jgi:hypothetical protein
MQKIFYTAVLATLIATSCSTPKMSVSDELKSGNDEYAVKGRNGTRINQKVRFGGYYTTDVNRSWTKGGSAKFGIGYHDARQDWVNIISNEYINKRQTIRFNLTDGKKESDVYCVSRFNARDLEIGKSPNSILNIGMDVLGVGGRSSSMYYVQVFTSGKDDRPWEMVIDNQRAQAQPKKYIGYLAKSRNEYYSIVPVNRMEMKNGKSGNTLAGTIGFEFRDAQDKPVAAVSLINNGVVFLGKISDEDRFLLANACTALLLQDEIE